MENNSTVSENTNISKNKKPKKYAVRWLIVLYDLICFFAVVLLLLGVYRGFEAPDLISVLVHTAVSGLCIFGARFALNIYNQIWRYGGISSFIRLLISDGIAFVLYFLIGLVLPVDNLSFARTLALLCLNLLFALAVRMAYRYAYMCNPNTPWGKFLHKCIFIFTGKLINTKQPSDKQKIKIAIVGAGRVGVSLAQELFSNAYSSYIPRCFIDIKREKIGRQIHGITVLSEEKATLELLREYEVQEIVFAIPGMDVNSKKRLYDYYKSFGFKIKVYDYPLMQSAGASKRALREFDIEELLFRQPITFADSKTNAYYKNKVVLITGGGGSIGGELCRQIAAMGPKQLIILDVYENCAYDVQQKLKMIYGDSLDLRIEITSVCNKASLDKIFNYYRPNIVLHAAAHKHVPLMEHNCCEAVENNVFGTLNTVEVSEKYGVERFIMVSTDKAVNPTNVMGATKRMCERIVQSYSVCSTKTVYSSTRFGNVLGSAGSVIPLFRHQIAKGGPVTITDKRIIRYFMTISEASQLVLQSGAMAKNGELFVLDMGKPVKIVELAENMIRLSGFEPYVDIDIKEIGLRPGEKLYEELLVRSDVLEKTNNSLIFVEKDERLPMEAINEKLEVLRAALDTWDDEKVKSALHYAVPTYKTPEEINADASDAKEMKEAEAI